jgi:hypothetical protein
MKKINKILYLLLAGMLSLTSCADFLNTYSPSIQDSRIVFENEGMIRSAVMGAYSQLSSANVYGQKMSVNWQGVSDIELASGYANSTAVSGKTSDTGAANFWADWTNQTTRWNEIFKLTELASTAIDGMRNSELIKTSPKVVQPYLGEALVLRSLAYFELTRRWGDVPYKDGPSKSDLSNVYLAKTDKDVIYAAIVKDMQEAIEYLPWTGSAGYSVERITKGFAKGLLARMALFAGGWSIRDGNQFPDTNVEHYPNLEQNPGMAEMNGFYVGRSKDWQKYYEIAEQQCAELIADPANPHTLDPDYGNIWKTVCGLKINPNNENLFEIANGVGNTGDIGTLMGRALNEGTLGTGVRGFGGTYVSTNGYYFYSFDSEDLRRDYACYFPSYQKQEGVNREVMQADIMSVRLGKWSYFWTDARYQNIHLSATGRVPTGINWILMRYSDIYLMFAEARYALSGADTENSTAKMTARQALEKVRERAFGAGSAKVKQYAPDFMDAIVNERAWEFGGEGIRKLDLVRWGLLDKKIEEMKEAMVFMIDGKQPVKIFDKIYDPTQFPDSVFFKYDENGEYIDHATANYYQWLPGNPQPGVYRGVRWFPGTYWNALPANAAGTPTTAVTHPVNILLAASGLRASYNYDELFAKLRYGEEIKSQYLSAITGNRVCNYRHVYAIYSQDIYESNGYLQNSYGFNNK